MSSRGQATARTAVRRAVLLLAGAGAAAAFATFAGAAPPPPFDATAALDATPHYVNDTAGSLYTFTVTNTGTTTPIGAVEIDRPDTTFAITGCLGQPSGWTMQVADTKCRFRSANGAADDLLPGHSLTFQVRATTLPGSANRNGTWLVVISKSNQFDTKSLLRNARPATGGALTSTLYTFRITDAVVSDATPAAGTACPAANKEATAGSTHNLLICGRNLASAGSTPVSSQSSLAGSFVGTAGTFHSGAIPANSGTVVLARWDGTHVTGVYGLLTKTVVAKVGSSSTRTSPLTTLTGYSATNRSPVTAADSYDTDEDTPLSVPAGTGVLANDSDPDGDSITATLGTDVTNGTLTLHADGSFAYTPDPDFFGQDTFTYLAYDGIGYADPETVTITVHPVQDPPVAVDDSATTDEDTQLTVPVLDNDSDVDGDTLTVTAVSGNAYVALVSGDVVFSPGGSFDSLAASDYSDQTFQYTISDGHGHTTSAHATVRVTGVDDAPVATDDGVSTAEDTPLTTGNLLTNDTDVDTSHASLTAALDDQASNGTAVVNSDGTFTYTPDGDFNGQDTFTYVTSDGTLSSSAATVTVTVTPVDDAPVATSTSDSTDEDTPKQLSMTASDVDGDTLVYTVVDLPEHGTLGTISVDLVTYTPDPDYHGTDSFTFRVNDGHGDSNLATFGLTVNPVNDAPVATGESYDAVQDTELVVAVGDGVLANDTDVDGDGLTASVVTDVSHGTLDLAADGSFTYTPGDGFLGDDTFVYAVSDGTATDQGTATIHVKPPNTAPVAHDVTPSDLNEDAPATAVTLDATDVDGDPLTYSIVDGPSHGSLGTVTGSSVDYTPAANFHGTDSFTFQANDGHLDSNVATVHLTILSANDPPVFFGGPDKTVGEDAGPQTFTGWATSISPGPADESGQTVTFHVSGDNNALFSAAPAVSSNGTLTFTTAPDANGVANMSVYATDDGGSGNGGTDTSGSQTFKITVTPVNDAPVATDDTTSTNEDTAFDVSVLTNDTDVDGDTLTVTSLVTVGTVGTATINSGNHTVHYSPVGHFDSLQNGETASDSFGYSISDGHGGTDSAFVSLTITGVNDVPTVTAKSISTFGNTLVTVGTTSTSPHVTGDTNQELLVGVSDPDDASGFTATADATSTNGGTVTANSDGTYSFLPAQGSTASDTFHFHVSDSHGGTSAAGTVTVTVTSKIWYVDDSAASGGDGRSTKPYQSLAPLDTASDPDGTGDTIFLYSGTYTGGFHLEASQHLVGQPQGLVFNSVSLVSASGTNPTVANGAGDAITLANDVDVQRVDVAASSGAGYKGTSITNATVGGSTTVTNAAGGGIVLSGSATGTISFGTAVSNTSGNAVSVSGRSGGSVTFSGNMTTSNGGVSLSSNTGATVSFSGNLHLTGTGSTKGFSATGGGTVNVTGSDNTVVTETGRAVEVTSTDIGSSGLTFKKVSAGTASAGPDSGIVLSSTGSSGGLTVTGVSGTAASGGDITKTTGDGVSLSNTDKVSLNWMGITFTAHSGIQGTGVTDFTLTHSTVSDIGTAANDTRDYAVAFNDASSDTKNNVDGTVVITSNTMARAYGGAVNIENYNGTIANATISTNSIVSTTSATTSKGSAIALDLFGSTTTVASLTQATIADNIITGFPSGDGIRLQGGNSASSTAPSGTYGSSGTPVSITGNQIAGDPVTLMNGMGILAGIQGRGSGNVSITNNGTVAHPITHTKGSGIGIGGAGGVTVTFTVTGNVINGSDNIQGSTALGMGVDKNFQADLSVLANPVVNAVITGNTVTSSSGYGIQSLNRDSNGTTRLRLSNNTVTGTFPGPFAAIDLTSGSAGSGSYNPAVCAEIANNTASAGGNDAFGNGASGITMEKFSTSSSTYVFGIVGLTTSPATAAQTETYVAGQNSGSSTGTGFFAGKKAAVLMGSNFTSCTLPF